LGLLQNIDSIDFIASVSCVKIRLLIDKMGKVSNVLLIKGVAEPLDKAVITAAYQMLWKPAIQNGRLIETWQDIAVMFK
jgi:hypothetical protein